MSITAKPNPFLLLALPLDATLAEIVERGNELYDTAETDEERLLFRWAKEQLITRQQERLVYEFFELPNTQYEDPAWDNFIRKYRRKPVFPASEEVGVADLLNIPSLLPLLVEALLSPREADLAVALAGSPFVPAHTLPLEVRDVIFG